MRIVHVAPTLFGDGGLYGGGERYPLELGRAMARRVPCRLVTFASRRHRTQDPSGLEIVALGPRVLLRGHPAHPVAPGLLRAVRDADIVHTHHLRSAPSRIAAAEGRVAGRTMAVTDHGLGGGGWLGLMPRLFHLFLAVSRYSAAILSAPPARTRVIYGGVDPARFGPDPTARREGVLFVGRLTPHKGIDRLLEAMPRHATLTVAGTEGHDARAPEQAYPRDLRRLAGRTGADVRFVGKVSEGQLPSLHARAAVFVLPSVHLTRYHRFVRIPELLGLSVLEAMACGTPVVCSRIGGVPEIVVDGETGFLVEPGNVQELRDRIAQLLGDRRLARRMGERGRDFVMERFTWDHVAERCLAAYEDAVASRS